MGHLEVGLADLGTDFRPDALVGLRNALGASRVGGYGQEGDHG